MQSQDSQSGEVVNATQRSSPPGDGKMALQGPVEVVEDSLKDVPEAYKGGAVRTPQPLPQGDDDEDEYYSVTPESKRSRRERQASGNGAKEVRPTSLTNRASDNAQANLRLKNAQTRARGFSDAEMVQGAKSAAVTNPASRAKLQPPKPDKIRHDQIDELQDDDDGLAMPIASSVKASNKRTGETADAAFQPPSTSKGKATTTTVSALEALRARKETQSGKTNGTISPANLTEGSPSVTAKGGQETNSTVSRKPVQSTDIPTVVQSRPTTGKLQPRKGGMFASTPLVSHATKRTNARDDGSDDTDEAAGRPAQVKPSGSRPARKTNTEATKKRDLPRTAKKETTYDVGESSGSERTEEPARGKGRRNAAPAKSQRGTAAKSALKNPANRSAQPSISNRGDAGPQNGHSVQPVAGRKSLKSRMKAESNAETPEAPESSPKAKAKAKIAASRRQPRRGEQDGPSTAGKKRPTQMDKSKDTDSPSVNENNNVAAEEAKPVKKPRSNSSAAETKKTETRASIKPALQGEGHSGDAPIVLSSREPTSSPDSTPQRRSPVASRSKDSVVNSTRTGQRSETPNGPASSPPTGATAHTLPDEVIRKKPTVIAFTKSGPQNQGHLSSKSKVKQDSTRLDRSSVPPPPEFRPGLRSSDRLKNKTAHKQSSSVASVKSNEAGQATEGSSVAGVALKALSDLNKRISNTEPLVGSNAGPTVAAVSQNGGKVEQLLPHVEDDTDFIHIDEFNVSSDMDGEELAIAKPEPKATNERTRSQIEMAPPPPPKLSGKKRAARAPVENSKRSYDSNADEETSSAIEAKLSLKKAHGDEDPQEPTSKRPRPEAVPWTDMPQLKRARISTDATLDEKRKPLRAQQKQEHATEPAKQPSQETSRQPSYGSQKVDIQGSPIPPGMTVQEKSTVLETHVSQQAGLLSDLVLFDDVVKVKTVSARRMTSNTAVHDFIPPSHQPDPMSSNKKRRPSGPEEESRGIKKVVMANHRHRYIEDEAAATSTDPFTSSDSNRKIPRQGSTSSDLFRQLKGKIQEETIAAILPDPATQDVQRDTKPTMRKGPVEDDPDKTLVNEDEPEKHQRKRKRIPSMSSVSSESSGSIDESAPIRDLGAWRSALQPHQMNVFDGLVMVSHKMVRHLVDKETATRDIVDDYRRHGMNIVEQMELSHAREYQKFVNGLKTRKKELRQEYINCSSKLKENVAAVEAARRERKEARARREDTVERLQQLMAEVC